MKKIENIKKEGEKIIITFNDLPKDFEEEVKIMEKIRESSIINYSEKIFLRGYSIEIHDPRLNKLTLKDLKQNFMYQKIFNLVYKTISEKHLVLKISLDDWYIEDDENIKLYRYNSFKEISDGHYYKSNYLRVNEKGFKKRCFERECLGNYEIDLKKFWNNNAENQNCSYKCSHCGKKVSALYLKEILEKEEME